MKRPALNFYRSWLRLNREGLTANTLLGYLKFKRAKAIGLLTAIAPSVPLMISDEMDLTRGWLWYGWSVVAIAWSVTVFGVIFYQSGKAAVRYYREWRRNRT